MEFIYKLHKDKDGNEFQPLFKADGTGASNYNYFGIDPFASFPQVVSMYICKEPAEHYIRDTQYNVQS